jgi:hypothetical protein
MMRKIGAIFSSTCATTTSVPGQKKSKRNLTATDVASWINLTFYSGKDVVSERTARRYLVRLGGKFGNSISIFGFIERRCSEMEKTFKMSLKQMDKIGFLQNFVAS